MPNFVIFGRMRSGSSMLCSYLDSHSKITCDLEVLHRKRYNGEVTGTRKHIKELITTAPTPIFGFKVLYHQMWGLKTTGFYVIREVLHSLDLKFIHIIRRNKLESYVSQILARQSSIWNAFENRRVDNHFIKLDESTLKRYNQPITISIPEYERYVKRSKQWEDAIRSSYDCLEIAYEDLPATLPSVLNHIGVEHEELTCETVKLRTKPLSELITNLDDVLQHAVDL